MKHLEPMMPEAPIRLDNADTDREAYRVAHMTAVNELRRLKLAMSNPNRARVTQSMRERHAELSIAIDGLASLVKNLGEY